MCGARNSSSQNEANGSLSLFLVCSSLSSMTRCGCRTYFSAHYSRGDEGMLGSEHHDDRPSHTRHSVRGRRVADGRGGQRRLQQGGVRRHVLFPSDHCGWYVYSHHSIYPKQDAPHIGRTPFFDMRAITPNTNPASCLICIHMCIFKNDSRLSIVIVMLNYFSRKQRYKTSCDMIPSRSANTLL